MKRGDTTLQVLTSTYPLPPHPPSPRISHPVLMTLSVDELHRENRKETLLSLLPPFPSLYLLRPPFIFLQALLCSADLLSVAIVTVGAVHFLLLLRSGSLLDLSLTTPHRLTIGPSPSQSRAEPPLQSPPSSLPPFLPHLLPHLSLLSV